MEELLYLSTAEEKDIPRILEIEQEAISPSWTHGALLSETYRDDSFFAVAVNADSDLRRGNVEGLAPDVVLKAGNESKESGKILGFVILRKTSEDEGELLQIAVDYDARRSGIADMLIRSALAFADEKEIKSVFLEVRISNISAISLYKKHGFSAIRTRIDYYSDPVENAIVMKLII